MIYKQNLTTDIEIIKLADLHKLKPLIKERILKVNNSQIARELEVDRRTVAKYLDGYEKPNKRASTSKIDEYKEEIEFLLSDETEQIFYYKRVLWQYLTDNKGLKCSTSAFRRYISRNESFSNSSSVSDTTCMAFPKLLFLSNG